MQSATAVPPIISEDMRLVDEEIDNRCRSSVDLVRSISSYIVKGGGKRLRPSVLLLSSGLCGLENGDGRIACAAAVELTHIASLLHDDVVDNASLRRGRRSSNGIWGDKCSVLVGDVLVARAFELIASCGDLRLIKIYSAAVTRVIEGEVMEVMGKRKSIMEMNENACIRIIMEKTASLIECCAVMGSILAGSANGRTEALGGYGLNLGIAFQLADDALDYCSSSENMGKDTGTDIAEAKMTFPLLKSLSNAPAKVQADIEKRLLSFAPQEGAGLIRRFVADYRGAEDTLEAAKAHVNKAKKAISFFPNGSYKRSLLSLADFAAERSH